MGELRAKLDEELGDVWTPSPGRHEIVVTDEAGGTLEVKLGPS